jgi:hypothetical protein
MWTVESGIKRFRHGLTDYAKARSAASECSYFITDDEDEIIDDSVSCYNCAYRRYSDNTISCLARSEKSIK